MIAASKRTLAVALCAHNQADQVRQTLKSLMKAAERANVAVRLLLLDDGSIDGTWSALQEFAINTEDVLIKGSGQLFWSRSMRILMRAYMSSAGPLEDLLWLNADTEMDVDGLRCLYDCLAPGGISVGSVRGTDGVSVTYGPRRSRSRRNPLFFEFVSAGDTMRIETFNGNVVLFARSAVFELGVIGKQWHHGLGDYDYGLRASNRGVDLSTPSHPVATCDRNPDALSWTSEVSFRRRFKAVMEPRGLPPSLWLRFAWSHFGMIGLLRGAAGYRFLLRRRSSSSRVAAS